MGQGTLIMAKRPLGIRISYTVTILPQVSDNLFLIRPSEQINNALGIRISYTVTFLPQVLNYLFLIRQSEQIKIALLISCFPQTSALKPFINRW